MGRNTSRGAGCPSLRVSIPRVVSEQILSRMFLPKFTLRQGLSWVLIAGVVSIVLAAAWQGKEWAVGQTAALAAATAVALLAAAAYWFFFLIGNFLTRRAIRNQAQPLRGQADREEAKS